MYIQLTRQQKDSAQQSRREAHTVKPIEPQIQQSTVSYKSQKATCPKKIGQIWLYMHRCSTKILWVLRMHDTLVYSSRVLWIRPGYLFFLETTAYFNVILISGKDCRYSMLMMKKTIHMHCKWKGTITNWSYPRFSSRVQLAESFAIFWGITFTHHDEKILRKSDIHTFNF
jgi:hypothetical protein